MDDPQGYIIAVFTARRRIAGVKLHHTLNRTLCQLLFDSLNVCDHNPPT